MSHVAIWPTPKKVRTTQTLERVDTKTSPEPEVGPGAQVATIWQPGPSKLQELASR